MTSFGGFFDKRRKERSKAVGAGAGPGREGGQWP